MQTTLVFLLSVIATTSLAKVTLPSLSGDIVADVKKIDSERLVEKPKIHFTHETQMEDGRYKAGQNLDFYCEAFGSPSINVYWTLNGKIVQGHRRRSLLDRIRNGDKMMIGANTVGSRLELECIDYRMSGSLACVADNGFEVIKNTVKLSIAGTGRCPRMRPNRPQIGSWTVSRFEEIGNSAVFQCRRASMGSTITWVNENEEPVRIEDGFLILPNGDLLVSPIKYEHIGSYYCIAREGDVEERTETFLYATDASAKIPTTEQVEA